MNPLLSVESALDTLLKAVTPLPTEIIPVPLAAGRFLSEAVASQFAVPSFDNSAMDGYAVRACDAAKAGALLKIRGRSQAGGGFVGTLGAGHAVRIFTGAPMPDGADAVIMQEDVALKTGAAEDGDRLQILDPVSPWENVRFRGEDVQPGQTLLPAGTGIGPHHLAVLIATGVERVPVHRIPRISLIANGSELRPIGSQLTPGQIPESNTPMLAALLERAGAKVVSTVCVPDDPIALQHALEVGAASSDIVITVGGASVGDHDLVRPALLNAGGHLDFWRVSMRPGKPFLHGRLGTTPVYGLPGNPVSAFVTAVILVLPTLRRLQGNPNESTPSRKAAWAHEVSNPDSRRHYVRVTTDHEGCIRLSGQQGSHRMASLASADGLVDLAPGTKIEAGASARVLTW